MKENNNNKVRQSEAALIKKIISDPLVRRNSAIGSHLLFFTIYFPHHIFYEMAPFQKEIFLLTQDYKQSLIIITAFRGSSKTTLISMSFPIWAIVGFLQKKHVLIISKTMDQARQLFKNIKTELETNDLLKMDLGPFQDESDEWKSHSLVLKNYNARISAISSEQSTRGVKHGAMRPDLIILDDVEDLNSVKSRETRDSVYKWFKGDIMPLGDLKTQIFIIGSTLHPDSLIMRLKQEIDEGMPGVYKTFPLLDEANKIAWPGKFPDQESIEIERKKINNEIAWQREMLLNPLTDEYMIIHSEWIQYYDSIDYDPKEYRHTISAVDPAIVKNEKSDFTAIVSGKVYGYGDKQRVYILPNPINKRMEFPETIETIKQVRDAYKSRVLIESIGFQKSFPQLLKEQGISVEEIISYSNDKLTRLSILSHLVQQGKILFPRKGAEELIKQLIYAVSEKHDDLIDAFTMLVAKAFQETKRPMVPEIFVIKMG